MVAVRWKDPVNGFWHEPKKWDSGAIPDPPQDVIINSANTSYSNDCERRKLDC